MPITNMDTLVAGLTSGDPIYVSKDVMTSGAGTMMSLWRAVGLPTAGGLPPVGAGEAPTKNTVGAIPFTNPVAPALAYLAQLAIASNTIGFFTLADRLVHTSGLNGTLLTEQVVNSVALTRHVAGIGVECWIEVYTTLGSTARVLSISYTNEEGVAGRVGSATIGGATAASPAGRMYQVQLQAGDKGVRSVQSVTLAATTGVVGDFGITLLKRVGDAPSVGAARGAVRDAFDLGMPEVSNDACLYFFGLSSATTLGPVTASGKIAKK